MKVSELIDAMNNVLEEIGDIQVCYLELAGREYYAYKFPVAVATLEGPSDEKTAPICALLSLDIVEAADESESAARLEIPKSMLN